MSSLVHSAFTALVNHSRDTKIPSAHGLFRDDPYRFSRFSIVQDDLLLDFSKNLILPETLSLLHHLAKEAGIAGLQRNIASAEPSNAMERQAMRHMALRNSTTGLLPECNKSEVLSELLSFTEFAELLRDDEITGSTGKSFTDVVNIGIGGAALGPAAVVAALQHYHDGPRVHYVSNVDPSNFHDVACNLCPDSTLFIISSKTCSTMETVTNTEIARSWVVEHLGEKAIRKHFCAVSANLDKCIAFGVSEKRVFRLPDWICGRCSVWSPAGVSVALAIGEKNFLDFLAGGSTIDEHFLKSPLETNIPVTLALLGIWYSNVLGIRSRAIIPYDQRLSGFVSHLQQLEMESNGKRVYSEGTPVLRDTSPVVWGDVGTNCQHSFFQHLHQGSDTIPVDFLIAANSTEECYENQKKLVISCFAQSRALLFGRNSNEIKDELSDSGFSAEQIELIVQHKLCPGMKPSNVLLYRQMTPYTMGRLLAIYEHRMLVQGIIWGINSFDQFGVELGKNIADELLSALDTNSYADRFDPSTVRLLQHYKKLRKNPPRK